MPVIGLKHPVVAKYGVTAGGEVEYKDGKVMAKAIKADIKWTKADAVLYADDDVDEELNSVIGGTITEEINELSYDMQEYLLGHKKDESKEGSTLNADDNSIYVGHGFFAPVIRNNVIKYRAVWLTKVKFSEPDETIEGKGEKPKIQSISIEGSINKDVKGDIKKEEICDTEAAAIQWLHTKAGILAV